MKNILFYLQIKFNFQKKKNYKVFTSEKELKQFLDTYYKDFFEKLSNRDLNYILTTHARPLDDTRHYDCEVMNILEKIITRIPPTPINILLYRGDDVNYIKSKSRKWLASSFFKNTAQRFTQKNKLYKIYIPKGTRILPTCAINFPGAFPEEEVLLRTQNLTKILTEKNAYIYISNQK